MEMQEDRNIQRGVEGSGGSRIRIGHCSGAGAVKDPVVDAYLVLAFSLVI
jgi:hypothetical protein